MAVDGLSGRTDSLKRAVSMPWLTPLLRCLSFCFSEGFGCGGSENEGGDRTRKPTNCQRPDNECETETPTTMKKSTIKDRWKDSFFHVDGWGRSPCRLLIIGLCLVACWGLSSVLTAPISLYRYIYPFGVLGSIFVGLSIIGPTLEVMINLAINKRKRTIAAQQGSVPNASTRR